MKPDSNVDKVIDILVCPICKGKLHYDKLKKELTCHFDKLAYPIRRRNAYYVS